MMRVLVTGGGTIAPWDDVRAITNASTGRFAARIAEACLARGAEVRHVAPRSAIWPFALDSVFDLETNDVPAELERLAVLKRRWDAVRDRLHRYVLEPGTVDQYAKTVEAILTSEPIDVVFLAAAVSDFAPARVAGKVDSGGGSSEATLRLHPTTKVIRSVRDWAPDVFLVGFKLLSDVSEAELIAAALRACTANRADLTVANDLALLRAGRHTVHLVRPEGQVETLGPGPDLAERLVERVFALARESGKMSPPPDPTIA